MGHCSRASSLIYAGADQGSKTLRGSKPIKATTPKYHEIQNKKDPFLYAELTYALVLYVLMMKKNPGGGDLRAQYGNEKRDLLNLLSKNTYQNVIASVW